MLDPLDIPISFPTTHALPAVAGLSSDDHGLVLLIRRFRDPETRRSLLAGFFDSLNAIEKLAFIGVYGGEPDSLEVGQF